eukprot:TRINITY_DN17717_c0_g1_i1.p1 TRINITY_DN17717_c0_g1~~TRINITY_DN17717_c0_g1_i1.p1  ORF type:complete len:156 (+),score=37.01 TRINITY_DN17717_c0_g1_i1:104-571(+)
MLGRIVFFMFFFFFQAEDGIRDVERSRGLGDVYKRQGINAEYMGPEIEGNFTLEILKRKTGFTSIFFNSLVNLNKFIDFEQRDVFAIKNELNENPNFSDWDRYAQNEYLRLAYEEENHEGSDVFDANDPWEEEGEDGGSDKEKEPATVGSEASGQ